ncbi:MAG TPA: AraC family transcriptional regulator [Gemmatimonadaceae bacterium]
MSSNVEPFRVRTLRETPHVSLARFDHPPGARLPTAFSAHEAAERFRINIVERGCFRLRYGRREWTLGAGSIFLSRPTDEYRYSHLKHVEADTCLRVEFSSSLAGDLADVFPRLSLVLPATNRLAWLQLQFNSLASDDLEMPLDTVACELLDAACNAAHDRHHLYRSEQLKWYARRIGAARELMDADPTAQHSLWHLSSRVSMSPFRFARVFRELIGMPPHKYLVRLRLLRARDLLQSGMSVTDVCYAVGFNNLSHFIRSFHGYFGVTPSRLKTSTKSVGHNCQAQ